MSSAILLVLGVSSSCFGFLLSPASAPSRRQQTVVPAHDEEVVPSHHFPERRSMVLGGVAAAAWSAAGAPPAGATDLKKFNAKLDSLGLDELSKIPDGFNALLESYTQSTPKLLVEFVYPQTWLVVRPSINTNGEAGTVSAGDYGKGDSAALYVGDSKASGKQFYQQVIVAGISQRGDNQYQNFDVLKVKPGTAKDYALVDFSYELLTGAGFVVERRGVASVTTVGSKAPSLIAVTTSSRWKKIEDTLRTMADSFRAYEQTSTVVDFSDT